MCNVVTHWVIFLAIYRTVLILLFPPILFEVDKVFQVICEQFLSVNFNFNLCEYQGNK